MISISLRIPQGVVDDLKKVAPKRGFSGYQPLIKAYISQGLQEDTIRFGKLNLEAFIESLRKSGIADEVIFAAIEEAGLRGRR